jgi:hypothetical protein
MTNTKVYDDVTLKPCKNCDHDDWEYLDDHDNGDWCEASYQCNHCKRIIYVELPD